ncbi:hypothetical protein BABINDRAFT_160937 [Babjeviella inositovora NRRL Y-12698]|uniref:Mitochondrial adapter protein MCP1 transmembrane domain-containing protein n=1 Tax=Babjeviella inositovora NRRL Y-12698 TaxID=984486 RepID=A0A1E3QUS7_9ASCO|nr:uncharacterized protein BABINDRAFT_160937 [Babjeviella inositovora NRRL Y-12698]ODQ80707.1 hypothetical protein BABINDRAFT_160937 [Babjeviella inositovora NRRL Y-12698]
MAFLRKAQKYSAYTFTGFLVLHGTSVVIAPLFSVPLANDLFSMGRSIYQAAGIELVLIWTSVPVHILLGVFMRVLKKWHSYGSAKHIRQGETSLPLSGDKDSFGLGGITSFLGLGERRSYVSRKFGLSPLQFSGYALTPMLIGHVLKERIGPLVIDGDSSLIDLSYISHALNKKGAVIYVGMVLLVWISSYHVVSGWMKYMKWYGTRSKRIAYMVINGMAAFAAFSMFQIGKGGLSTGFIGKQFDAYLDYLE